jgi:hypothetical protein
MVLQMLSFIQGADRWIVSTPLSVSVYVTLATQYVTFEIPMEVILDRDYPSNLDVFCYIMTVQNTVHVL